MDLLFYVNVCVCSFCSWFFWLRVCHDHRSCSPEQDIGERLSHINYFSILVVCVDCTRKTKSNAPCGTKSTRLICIWCDCGFSPLVTRQEVCERERKLIPCMVMRVCICILSLMEIRCRLFQRVNWCGHLWMGIRNKVFAFILLARLFWYRIPQVAIAKHVLRWRGDRHSTRVAKYSINCKIMPLASA